MIQGVIFDMDGLMFDTERLGMQVWDIVGKECGIPIPRALIDRMRGRNQSDCRTIFQDEMAGKMDFDGAWGRFSQKLEAIYAGQGVPIKAGLYELLPYLREHGFRVALATSTSREIAFRMLQTAKVEAFFDAYAFGDQVERGKPAPDIFLRACRLLGLEPACCLVLEDSPAGITAAHRAGCLPVMIPDLAPPTLELEPLLWAKCETLRDVIPMLQAEVPSPSKNPSEE